MPFYQLVRTAKARADAIVDEIKLSAEHTISATVAREIPEELLKDAEKLAARLGFKVVEAEEPEVKEVRQPVGDDVRGMSPINVGSGGGQPGAGPTNTPPAPQGTPTPSQVQSPPPGSSGPPSSSTGQTPTNS